jgi:uncharacterized protein YaiL (DUF2058 family)
MSDTLRDQLLGLGFKPAPRAERPAPDKARPGGAREGARDGRRPEAARHARKPEGPRQGRKPEAARHDAARPDATRPDAARRRGEMDLAKAYAIRAQKEKDERIAAERERQLEAQRRREGKAKLAELLKTATLNDAAADIARHFEYGGKIRRIHVTAEQLRALNAGELAVVQQAGRYHLVTAAHGQEAEALLSGALALLVDPNTPSADDQYADPKYQVPDDLVW